MSSGEGPNHLQRKVSNLLSILEEEGEQVMRSLSHIGRKVTQSLDTALTSYHRLDCCTDSDIKKTYQEVSQELEVMEEQITIICATISSLPASGENTVEDIWEEKPDLSSSSNYLLEKVARKMNSIKREVVRVQLNLDKQQNNVKEIVEKAQDAAKMVLSIRGCELKMLQAYKVVSMELGSMDMEITMVSVQVSSWAESLVDEVETASTSKYKDSSSSAKRSASPVTGTCPRCFFLCHILSSDHSLCVAYSCVFCGLLSKHSAVCDCKTCDQE
eukprot:GFUD01020742.1.p1 GENE.GFUD01020742.1~~GFUD01020742.1.p1  ORF type:complete len:273 (+),score=81.00 GFUD01020742.1:53-871(+)